MFWSLIIITFTQFGPVQQIKAVDLTQSQCYYQLQMYRNNRYNGYCAPQRQTYKSFKLK